MTREEAIYRLKNMAWLDGSAEREQTIKAIDMAIEALHQKGAYEQTKWERDMALQTLEEHGIGLGQKAEYIIPSGDVMFTSDVVRCKDCKHRPHLENENGSDYGFNVSGDEMCPCVNNDDGWYSWMPKDNFYCGFGERKGGADAEAVQLKQTDTLIIADALRYLAQDEERHLSDRTRADALRGQILKYGASMCHSAEAVQGEWEDKEVFNETDDDHIVDEWQSAKCSVCGKYHTTPFMYYFDNFNFCPNCGADMRKENK